MMLDDSSDFKESLEIVDLSGCHGQQDECFEEGPHDHSWVGAFIDIAVDPLTQVHVILLVFDVPQGTR